MNTRAIAVTGLNATDNPAPGVGVIRSLRAAADADDRVVGLAYDALDPGIYAKDVVEDVFLMPYPSSSVDAFLARLSYVHERAGLDVVIPTLDAELPAFIALAPRLASMGIGSLLPSRHQLDLRSKANLEKLGQIAQIDVPRSVVITSVAELTRIHERIEYPFLVKGVFYGATLVSCFDEAVAAFHKVAAQWGLPIIVQACVSGEELNVVGLGDGEGGLWGAVPMKKLLLTDKGKGWAGITIADRGLIAVAERFVQATRWRGPFEVEVIRDREGRYQLLEINPRFPAWVHLAASAGVNLPRAVVDFARGGHPKPAADYEVGKMFVRISLDQIASVRDLERVVMHGEVLRGESERPTLDFAGARAEGGEPMAGAA
jgi:carbamoyl-phosphate synthase large subunit